MTDQLEGSLGGVGPDIEVIDVEGTQGLETYIAMLADIPGPMTASQLERAAEAMQSDSQITNLEQVTVAGRPAVHFTLTQAGLAFEVVMVTSGNKMVILLGGTLSGGEIAFDEFVDSLQFR